MPRLARAAETIAAASIAAVFALFVIGVGARHLADRPIPWIDEVVTILAAWSTFWTAALVLRWREFIAFDVAFSALRPTAQRATLALGLVALLGVLVAALPGIVDYTRFLWRETTDQLRWRLDFAYAVFPAFVAVIAARVVVSLRRLLRKSWRDELAAWSSSDEGAA